MEMPESELQAMLEKAPDAPKGKEKPRGGDYDKPVAGTEPVIDGTSGTQGPVENNELPPDGEQPPATPTGTTTTTEQQPPNGEAKPELGANGLPIPENFPDRFRVNANKAKDERALQMAQLVQLGYGSDEIIAMMQALKPAATPSPTPAPGAATPSTPPPVPASIDDDPTVKAALAAVTKAQEALTEAHRGYDPAAIPTATSALYRAESEMANARNRIVSRVEQVRDEAADKVYQTYEDAHNVNHPFGAAIQREYAAALQDPARANDPELPLKVTKLVEAQFVTAGLPVRKKGVVAPPPAATPTLPVPSSAAPAAPTPQTPAPAKPFPVPGSTRTTPSAAPSKNSFEDDLAALDPELAESHFGVKRKK